MAAELHWFPFYGADWLGSTAVSMMLPEQEGAYLRLLVLAWADGEKEPSLPADSFALAQMSRLGSRWKKLGPLVAAQFEEINGRLFNAKLTSVWQEQQLKHAKTVAKASAGGKAKADKVRAQKAATAVPQAVPGAVPQAVLVADQKPASSSAQSSAPALLQTLPIQNLESEEAVERGPKGPSVLPASAPEGALAPDGARAPGAGGRTPHRNGSSTGAPNPSAILAQRATEEAEPRARARLVARWCDEHPDDAARLRTELAREFRGDDAIIAKAREAAFTSHVLRAMETADV